MDIKEKALWLKSMYDEIDGENLMALAVFADECAEFLDQIIKK